MRSIVPNWALYRVGGLTKKSSSLTTGEYPAHKLPSPGDPGDDWGSCPQRNVKAVRNLKTSKGAGRASTAINQHPTYPTRGGNHEEN